MAASPVEIQPRTPWRQSLYFRVIVLCGVLLFCLLASVMAITRFYFGEAVQRMEEDAQRIASRVQVLVEENQNLADAEEQAKILAEQEGFDRVELREEDPGVRTKGTVYVERRENGALTWVALMPLSMGGRNAVMRATIEIVPQVEIVRAFKNRYVLALIGVFIITLGLMIYFIARALRPLRDLSASCSAIAHGDLQAVATRNATGEIRALEETFNTMVDSLREKALMETKLRQAQRLSALGNLAAGVAHDVRNPLNAIKLLSSHALDLSGQDSPAAKSLQTIRNEVARLEDIVSSFLSLARERELAPAPQRVDAMLEDCVRLFQKEAEDRKVRLSAELRAGDTRLMLDAQHWNRAILNVILNALEACPPGGRVRIFSRLTADACQIEVRDDGPGLSAEALERVFEPYFTTKPGGTGLGLAITRGIVQEHGGGIEISSSPGQGCQVLITMPLETTKAP